MPPAVHWPQNWFGRLLINIAYVDEVSDACERHGIDVSEVIDASATKPFGFVPFVPGLGVGGFCIPINPHNLLYNCKMPLLKFATEGLAHRPVQKALEFSAKNPKDSKILVIGIAWKPGQDNMLNAPAVPFVDTLIKEGRDVTVYDPFVKDHKYKSLKQKEFKLSHIDENFDAVCVTCRHPGVQTFVHKLKKAEAVIF